MPLLLSMSFLLIFGFLALGGTFAPRRRLLKEAFEEGNDNIRELLYQPFQELLLGFVFTFAGFFFAQRIFGGRQSLLLALAIAAGIAVMATLGTYSRLRHAAQTQNLPPELIASLLRLQKISCLGNFCVLLGLLAGLARLIGFG
ncbi:MAG: hypothetical protein GX927_11400 [Lentisphaerae bacterium]|nr:hypothetical protein [Lentisphaerota bacterium]